LVSDHGEVIQPDDGILAIGFWWGILRFAAGRA